MDVETYDHIALNADCSWRRSEICKRESETSTRSDKGNVFSVEPPLFVELAITETEPACYTAQGATKPESLKQELLL